MELGYYVSKYRKEAGFTIDELAAMSGVPKGTINKIIAGTTKSPTLENAKKEKEIFTDADIKKLEADGSETAKIILMLIYTGMRIGELFSLPLEDYHQTYVIGGEKTRPLAKLSKAVKIADTSNQGEAKRKAFSAVTVTLR